MGSMWMVLRFASAMPATDHSYPFPGTKLPGHVRVVFKRGAGQSDPVCLGSFPSQKSPMIPVQLPEKEFGSSRTLSSRSRPKTVRTLSGEFFYRLYGHSVVRQSTSSTQYGHCGHGGTVRWRASRSLLAPEAQNRKKLSGHVRGVSRRSLKALIRHSWYRKTTFVHTLITQMRPIDTKRHKHVLWPR